MARILVVQADSRERGTMKRLSGIYITKMQELQHEVRVVDLAKLDYDKTLSKGYKTERTPEMLAINAFAQQADLLAFFYPIWFANVPSALKGFIENLFWVGETYSFRTKQYLLKGMWRGKKARIVYSMGGSEFYHYLFGWSGYRGMRQPLWLSGIFSIRRTSFDNMDRTKHKPAAFYEKKMLKMAAHDDRRLRGISQHV
ncbi:NAD(P)H-dependent oxidoreductase [Listeria cornellensis]|uniref:NAD(P)H dehydrogenase [quinone] 1 n=1 Tax=Listeria cornellensis FSL F6-0969 TaxID=1265820 RepID=W7BRC3_9LIST|nr:NAD(P)H-dependent oxidoreductase [Listeria cornellensis]EUJ25771.1 NAD(P)H dehydrogenase [quinone] 1 [Listeria cornellensis FSL F6-0969]